MDIKECFDTKKSWADYMDESDTEEIPEKDEELKQPYVDENSWSVVEGKKRKKKTNIGDKIINCVVCKKDFVFSKEEQDYFRENGWNDRKKCKECKQFQKFKNKYGNAPNANRRKIMDI